MGVPINEPSTGKKTHHPGWMSNAERERGAVPVDFPWIFHHSHRAPYPKMGFRSHG